MTNFDMSDMLNNSDVNCSSDQSSRSIYYKIYASRLLQITLVTMSTFVNAAARNYINSVSILDEKWIHASCLVSTKCKFL